MRIIGIDPGKTTGLALLDATDSGWMLLRRYDMAPEGEDRGEQLVRLEHDLGLMLQGADVVVMEEMLAYRQATADEKVEAQAMVKYGAWRRQVPLITYAPATVRSVICRDGRADERTIRETLKFLARAPQRAKKGEGWSAHQLDALAVALCHLARMGMVLDRCVEGEACLSD